MFIDISGDIIWFADTCDDIMYFMAKYADTCDDLFMVILCGYTIFYGYDDICVYITVMMIFCGYDDICALITVVMIFCGYTIVCCYRATCTRECTQF